MMHALITLLCAALLGLGCAEEVDPNQGVAPPTDAPVGGMTGEPEPPPEPEPMGGAGGGPPVKQERMFTLRINDAPAAPLTLDMNRDEVAELLGAVADDIVLLELDPIPLLRNVLRAIKTACGTDWQRDTDAPQYDCNLTALGQTFDAPWERSPEFSLIRVLTMTPAHVIVDGTSIDFLQSVADFFNIGGGFSQILADTLTIETTDEIVGTAAIVASLRENLLVPHPNTVNGGRIRITLRDALNDLSTLAEKLGPVPGHPGILDPASIPNGAVFGPDFRMQVIADSNIRVVDGVKASGGLDNLNVLVDTTGPTFDDPLEFDFQDPARFNIQGLVAEPTVDMRFAIFEDDRFAAACAGDDSCQRNMPDTPLNNDSIWSLPPYTLEYITAYAAWLQYETLRVNNCYVACALTEVSIGQEGNPAGWTVFGVPLNLGPQNQYVWEFVAEVAQVALHGPNSNRFAEGEVDVEFTLTGVVAGITGEEAAEATRPFLQAQATELAQFILGNFRERSGDVDFYYRRADDGTAMLYYIAPEDLAEGLGYGWQTPGFFADPGLTQKVSSTDLDGIADRTHEKLVVRGGEQIVYMQDNAGRRYRVRIEAASPGHPSIDVFVAEL
jgi:hypothetical protein